MVTATEYAGTYTFCDLNGKAFEAIFPSIFSSPESKAHR